MGFSRDLWKRRNDAIHGSKPTQSVECRRKKVTAIVIQMYKKNPKLRPSDRSRLFNKPLKDKLKSTTTGLEAWVCNVKTAAIAKRNWEDELNKGLRQQTIAEWMKGSLSSNSN